MRVAVLMIPGNPNAEAGAMPDEKLIAAMMKYNEDLAQAGILLALDGFHPTSRGARLRFSGGKPIVKRGPFAGAKDVVGGYWLWRVGSMDEAIEWASRCPAEENDVLEIRQVFEAADFGPEVASREAGLMDQIAKGADKDRERTTT